MPLLTKLTVDTVQGVVDVWSAAADGAGKTVILLRGEPTAVALTLDDIKLGKLDLFTKVDPVIETRKPV